MAELLTGLTPQTDFPRVDLNEQNADLLELMMANVGILQQHHDIVEDISWIFRVGHRAILHSTAKVYDDSDRLAAVNHGVAMFEAITAMVDGIAAVSDPTPVNNQAGRLIRLDTTEVSNYFDSSVESFKTETPRTAEVIRASSARFQGPLTTYALLGAAMSRQFELDSVA